MLYAPRFDNLGEMDQFLDIYNLSKLIQEEIDDLSRPIYIKEIESTVNNLLHQKTPGPESFTSEFIKHLWKEL